MPEHNLQSFMSSNNVEIKIYFVHKTFPSIVQKSKKFTIQLKSIQEI
jgi:hypothetical protein